MKIDIFAHFLPKKYLQRLNKRFKHIAGSKAASNRATFDVEMRLKLMDRYPDVLQVLTIVGLSFETLVSPEESPELAKIANDELAELIIKHPDKFIGGVALLPINNIDAALLETDRAINQLGFKGVQVYARLNGEQLDDPKYKMLYKKMAEYDLPIWIHPDSDKLIDESVFGWPFATANAMRRLVVSGIFSEFPNIKFITHHCGALAPYFEGRIKWLLPLGYKMDNPARNWWTHFHKFYNDTATYGSTSALMCGYNFFGVDRLLFGSDAPLGPHYGLTLETIESVQRMNISDSDKEKIFVKNAVNLLKIAI